MTSTRPPSNDPADIAKWEEEKKAHRERMDKQDQFQDSMLQFAARTDTTLTRVVQDMQAHAVEDREQFARERRARRRLAREVRALGGQVTQTATTSDNNWKLVAGIAGAAVTIFGIIWAIWTALKPG